MTSSWIFVRELWGWRQFENRRQVAAAVGLTPTPYQSGESRKEQGISHSGNRRVRALAVEIAWSWLRLQPDSELSRWYRKRFGEGGARSCRALLHVHQLRRLVHRRNLYHERISTRSLHRLYQGRTQERVCKKWLFEPALRTGSRMWTVRCLFDGLPVSESVPSARARRVQTN